MKLSKRVFTLTRLQVVLNQQTTNDTSAVNTIDYTQIQTVAIASNSLPTGEWELKSNLDSATVG